MTAGRFKSKFSRSPRKGTLARLAITLALRPEGATLSEILEASGRDPRKLSYRANLYGAFVAARDMCGWDFMFGQCPPEREAYVNGGRRPVLFKIVGKMRWDGGYRSLTK